jgi:hypothetical protein
MVLIGDWAFETDALHPTNQRTKETEDRPYLRMMVLPSPIAEDLAKPTFRRTEASIACTLVTSCSIQPLCYRRRRERTGGTAMTLATKPGTISVAVSLLLAACGGGAGRGGGVPAPVVTLPPINGQFDYQIGGAYAPDAGVAVVDRDRSDPPVTGKYNLCYVNAFQTQPGEGADWRTNHPDLLLRANGTEVTDPNWPGEVLLDTSTSAKRDAILAIVGAWIDKCAEDGFQAVEPDNLDSWTRSQGLLTQADNVAMATLLAARAHAAGLAIAQKNTSEIASLHAQIGFDFAVVEECQPYGDCDAFSASYGTRWFEIEYTDSGGLSNFQAACAARGASVSIIYRDRNVVPASDTGHYLYQSC